MGTWSALETGVYWPTKSWLVYWWQFHGEHTASGLEGGCSALVRRSQVSSVGRTACCFLHVWVLTNSWAVAWQYGPGEGQGTLDYWRDAYIGYGPLEATMGIWGEVRVGHVNAHQENHFQSRKGTRTSKGISWRVGLKWPPGSMSEWEWGAAASRDGIIVDMVSHPLRQKMPATVLSATRETKDCRWSWERFSEGKVLHNG